MPRKGLQVNHLAFTNYIILFFSGRRGTLKLITKTLSTYEAVPRQKINKGKSYFLLAPGTGTRHDKRVARISGIK